MKSAQRQSTRNVIALLLVGSAIPVSGWPHSEGVEAADPATPPAVLELTSAVRAYSPLRASPVKWAERIGSGGASASAAHGPMTESADAAAHMHTGHGTAGQQTPATNQR